MDFEGIEKCMFINASLRGDDAEGVVYEIILANDSIRHLKMIDWKLKTQMHIAHAHNARMPNKTYIFFIYMQRHPKNGTYRKRTIKLLLSFRSFFFLFFATQISRSICFHCIVVVIVPYSCVHVHVHVNDIGQKRLNTAQFYLSAIQKISAHFNERLR